MHIVRLLVAIACAAAFAGCVSRVSLSPESIVGLEQSSVAYPIRPIPDLVMFSLKDATAGIVGGAIGGALAAASGDSSINRKIIDAGTKNPNEVFRSMMLARLQSGFGISLLGEEGVVFDPKEMKVDLEASSTNADYILDYWVGWSSGYQPLNWTRYYFQFTFALSLTQRKTGEVVFSDHFFWQTPKSLGFPTLKEFTTDPHKGVQAQIDAACAAASEHFSRVLTK
jgi:hypothetical protein